MESDWRQHAHGRHDAPVTDHARLTSLANAAFDTVPDTAEELLSELDRARIVRGGAKPPEEIWPPPA